MQKKPFNKNAAQNGAKVVTTDGREVKMLYFEAKGTFPIVALVPDKEGYSEFPYSYTESGNVSDNPEFNRINNALNLWMAE